MKPDRSNYEIWLIDWLDGNLDDSGIRDMLEFLEVNPDIKQEFDSLEVSHLTPENMSFPHKEKLVKSVSELPRSQIEYLSVASLEKDITSEQKSELDKNLNNNPENRKLFESFQKIRLLTPKITYKNKNLLKKNPFVESARRYVFAGLSVAAVIAILVLSYIFVPQLPSGDEKNSASQIKPSTSPAEPLIVRTMVIHSALKEKSKAVKLNDLTENYNKKAPISITINKQDIQSVTDPISSPEILTVPGISEIPSPECFVVNKLITDEFLVASNNTFVRPLIDDERSRFGKFIARNFREKLFKDDSINDAPLKTYEIAEAGIDGINKLLGWQIALVRTTDDSGELKSIYFSSKILKFNAPVKKPEMRW